MRRLGVALSIAIAALPLLAQEQPIRRPRTLRPSMTAPAVDAALKQASEQLAASKKICDRDVDVLGHLRVADRALIDPMQPENAVQKAYEEVEAAKTAENSVPPPAFVVLQGLVSAERELESARRSPATTDFPHLRSVLRDAALMPASRVVTRDALDLQDEMRAWLRVQQAVADYVKVLADISSESLRASEGE